MQHMGQADGKPHGVGLYLAVVQFLFALGWIVYAAALPGLADQVGIARRWVPWLLALDQVVFIVTDLLVGRYSDRVAQLQGHLAQQVLAATLLSCAAFIALPWVAPQGSAPLFLLLMVVWAATSSALRAPPLALLGRYVQAPSRPAMVALMALGLGLAQALAPYVALTMKGVDPRWPFLISAATLAAVTLGMRAAERALAQVGSAAAPGSVPGPTSQGSAAVAPRAVVASQGVGWGVTPVTIFLLASALAALAFQAHTFVVSAPLYLRQATAAQLPALLPVFWIGFSLGLFPAAQAAKKWPPLQAMAAGALLAAVAAAAASSQPNLPLTVAAQVLAGLGWALLLASAMTAALALGDAAERGIDRAGPSASRARQPDQPVGTWGMTSSWLCAILAGAALLRLLFVATQTPTPAQVLGWALLPAGVFAVVGLALWHVHSRVQTARVRQGPH